MQCNNLIFHLDTVTQKTLKKIAHHQERTTAAKITTVGMIIMIREILVILKTINIKTKMHPKTIGLMNHREGIEIYGKLGKKIHVIGRGIGRGIEIIVIENPGIMMGNTEYHLQVKRLIMSFDHDRVFHHGGRGS